MPTGNYTSSISEPIEDIEAHGDEEDQLEPAGGDGSLLDAMQMQFGTTPWWVVSAVVHAVIFLLVGLLGVALAEPVRDAVVISSPPPKKHVEKLKENAKRDLFKKRHAPMEKIIDKPMIVTEPVPDDHFETENEINKNNTARGQQDAISDIPLGGTGVTGVMGVGGGGMAGAYGFRDGGGRKKATARWGGSIGSESAVEAALAWLARHQEADGHWDAKKWEGTMKTDTGITGLALLAFLGAGYTETDGKWKNNVSRATQWLIKSQAANGALGTADEGTEPNGVGYHHPIAGLALAEAYGMGKNAAVGAAAQKAITYSVGTHQTKGSGWRYTPGMEADLSVTGWFVMQMKSAKVAGLSVPASSFTGALAFTDSVSDQYGKCRYKADWLSPNPTMTSVGMLCRLYTGSKPDDPKVSGGANFLLKSLPMWGENGVGVNMYYWYYGTMTMFQVGGAAWKKWNTAMRDMLCDNQRKGGPKDGTAEDVDGSWDPVGAWATRGGRVYSTAIGALCLEVYYRYLPIYKQ